MNRLSSLIIANRNGTEICCLFVAIRDQNEDARLLTTIELNCRLWHSTISNQCRRLRNPVDIYNLLVVFALVNTQIAYQY